MFRFICSSLVIITVILLPHATKGQDEKEAALPDLQFGLPQVWGDATNGLRPFIVFEKNRINWSINVGLLAQTNFSQNSWLKTTNRSGLVLQLWLTNGTAIISTNQSVLAAGQLPEQTTVADIMKGVYPRSARSRQWWRTEFKGSIAGETAPLASFSLQDMFNVSFTNDVVLQISPLIYKVDADEMTARLVEFPPTKVRLMANGEVRKEE